MFIKSFLFLCAVALLTLMQGETPLDKVWDGILLRVQEGSDLWNPLLDERLPRLIVLISTGAALSVAGAVMQSLFHNPLASPSVLGISSGGCLCVVIIFILGWRSPYPYTLPLAACIGSLATLFFVYTISKWQREAPLTNLILTGIAVSTLLIAAQGALLYALRSNWQLIQTITEWEAGSTMNRNWQHVHMQLPLTIAGLWGCWHYRRELDVLSLGEEEATNLGVDVTKVRFRLFLCIALLVGGALAAMGMIAFFGLVLPHIIRRLQGPDHLALIPSCMIIGPIVLTTLDLLLRYLNWHDLSIGNISAILGGVFFLFLLFYPKRLLQSS